MFSRTNMQHVLSKRFQKVRQSPSQKFYAYSFAVDKASEASAALEASTIPFDGKCPDALFLCAGKSRPGFFVEQSEELLVRTMEETYWAQAWTAFVGNLSHSMPTGLLTR